MHFFGKGTRTDNIPETQEPTEETTDAPANGFNIQRHVEEQFKLPICYNKEVNDLKDNIIQDLELVDTKDPSYSPLYNMTFAPVTDAGRWVLSYMPKYYTSDRDFLKDTQKILKEYITSNNAPDTTCLPVQNTQDMVELWKELKTDTGFRSTYHYIEWSRWEFLNQSETFLQFISMYSLASPILSFVIPFVIMILPFFILKVRGIHVTMEEYKNVLHVVAANHAIFKLFTNFSSVNLDQKIYLLLSSALYVFSIYQNFHTCVRFYQNMKKIHKDLCEFRGYLQKTVTHMEMFLCILQPYRSYTEFHQHLEERKDKIVSYIQTLQHIQGTELCYKNLGQIGKLMKSFYDLHDSEEHNKTFSYVFGYNGYIENLTGLCDHMKRGNLGMSSFNKNKGVKFTKSYYGALINSDRVCNNLDFAKNTVITGPNASGKTTTLKTALINIIMTQQFGCGYYKKANMIPYHHIHCYLNIPDTSGRDSLFQAEARRCKEIIDVVDGNSKLRHFCVFDELYSGTNPDEAVDSATAFMKYITRNKNVRCLLTTHFIPLCNHLDKEKNMVNVHMETEKGDGEQFTYTYLLKKGISHVKGGMKVLRDMEFPKELLNPCNDDA